MWSLLLLASCGGGSAWSQEHAPSSAEPPAAERWNLFYQATSVGQYHGTFHSPYSGAFSVQNYQERDVSPTN